MRANRRRHRAVDSIVPPCAMDKPFFRASPQRCGGLNYSPFGRWRTARSVARVIADAGARGPGAPLARGAV
ncbi:MAG TPA: hypothetical protein VF048_04480, partial [Gemmatimonadaceae bacterium]